MKIDLPDDVVRAIERYLSTPTPVRQDGSSNLAALNAVAYIGERVSEVWHRRQREPFTIDMYIRELMEWAKPIDPDRMPVVGYTTELLPMFVRIGSRTRAERLALIGKELGL